MSQRIPKRTRLLIAAAVLLSLVGCDQVTKRIATSSLKNEPARTWLNESVRLEYALNPGGFLSLGASLSPGTRNAIFIGLNAIVLGAIAWFLSKRWNTDLAVFLSLSCILAGGLGNLIDRIANDGLVIDFINLGVGPVRTGVFNVADIGVTAGVVTLIVVSRRSLTV